MKIVDSHLHLDLLHDEALFGYIRDNLQAVVIWAFCTPRPRTFADLADYFVTQQTFADYCTSRWLPCYRLAGIHPRCIPSAEPATQAKVDALLESQLGRIHGIGEIGLETGSDAEHEILAMQIDFARRHGLKACIHTPRQNKDAMLLPTLAIVAQSGIAPENVLIDHLDSSLGVWSVVNMGYHAGVTISPAKSKLNDVLEILAENANNLDKIMLNSDLATDKLVDYQMFVDSVNALPPQYAPVCGQTALSFFGINNF